jgi:hypothetical protein
MLYVTRLLVRQVAGMLQRLPGAVELLDLLDTLGQRPHHGSQRTPPLERAPTHKHRVDQTLTHGLQAAKMSVAPRVPPAARR